MKTEIIVLMISLFSIQIIAQTEQDSINQLKEITINARSKTIKEHNEFKRHGQFTELLSSQEINRNNPAFLEQSLGVMAGVQVDKRTQAGGQRIVIRGYGNDQKFNNWGIKAYYNQIPLTNAEGVTILDDVDFSIVENIEVVKGPASTMYGAGVGGVVRFYLKNSEEKGIALTQNTTTGSFNLFQTNTRLDYVTDNASMLVNFGHLQSDGYRPNGQSLKNFITYKGDFKFTDKQNVSVFLSHNYSHEGISGQIPYSYYYANNDPGNNAYIIKNSRLNMQSTRFAVSNNSKFSNSFRNSTVLFYSGTDSERVVAGANEQFSSPNYGLRSVFTISNAFSNSIDNVIDIGTEIQQCKSLISNFRHTGDLTNPLTVSPIASGNYYIYTTNQQSVFIHNRINFKKADLAVILGLSGNRIGYDRNDLLALPGLIVGNTKNTSFTKSFTTSYNPHIAVQKTFKDQIINISYSEGYNAPTASTSYIAALNKTNDDLIAEKAKMVEVSAQGLLFNTRLDYQVSIFNMNIENKLTLLSAANPAGGSYNYTANTGNQLNKGLEASVGYVYEMKSNPFLSKVTSFVNFSYYDFKYTDFSTKVGSGALTDYSNNKVVGVPKQKYSVGLDFQSLKGIYLNSTFNYLSEVYSDFANTNSVNGFGLLNAKLGYKLVSKNKKISLDFFVGGNNLTNQTNYTFLFLGGSINDFDAGNGFPTGMAADVNPGSSKAYFWNGINLKYHFQ
jgi:iron complex outermembrane receptor protein